jgi:hypothetical protein
VIASILFAGGISVCAPRTDAMRMHHRC